MDPLYTPSDIEEFRAIWREEFDEDLSPERAELIANRFLSAIHQIVTLIDRADAKEAAQTKFDEGANEMAK